MELVSPNGDDGANVGCSCTGFTGQLTAYVTFTLDNDNQLEIHYQATTNADTVINMTNHSYFQPGRRELGLGVRPEGLHQRRFLHPDRLHSDPGRRDRPVKGTPFDFLTPQTIGSQINVDNK